MNEDGTSGFSLIELVVCVAVLAVLAVGAGLVASRSGSAALQSDSQRFLTHLHSAQARAIQGRAAQGLFVQNATFSTATQGSEGWQQSATRMRWRGRVSLQLDTPRAGPDTPHIVLLPDGQMSAFKIAFNAEGSSQIRCQSDGLTKVVCK